MFKYVMKNKNDYRLSKDNKNHGVLLIKQKNDTSWAYGYFLTKDHDMYDVNHDEKKQIEDHINDV